MKKVIYLTLILFLTNSCKKYERDNGYSTYTVKGRLAGQVWNCGQIINLNNSDTTLIPRFSCILNFDKKGQFEILVTTISGIVEKNKKKYELKSNKDFINLDGIDFEIKSLTWSSFIIKSTISNKEYYFEKWMYLDYNNVTREDIYYPFPLIE
jgi:hypothetical protein